MPRRPDDRDSERGSESNVAPAAESALAASRALVGVAAHSLATIEDTVTLVQYRVLVLLTSGSVRTAGGLASALGVHPSTATRLCDRLVDKDLISRQTAPENRRVVVIALTAKGRSLIRSVTTRRRREITKIVSRLDAQKRTQLISAFAAFARAAGEDADQAWLLGWTT